MLTNDPPAPAAVNRSVRSTLLTTALSPRYSVSFLFFSFSHFPGWASARAGLLACGGNSFSSGGCLKDATAGRSPVRHAIAVRRPTEKNVPHAHSLYVTTP
uniref:Uncharacterized protein n=1 Tax=Trypanosoma vivax (strain Y486) TaxID=1055687 RepID=G0UBX8_TRYVY|nr:hypothetical protein TVY486_1108100 [Trypanosoma vivax Y486]